MYDYLTNRESLSRVFVLIDSKIPPQKIDLEFIWELFDEQIPFDIIFTKSDKIKTKELNKNINNFKNELKKKNIALPEFFVSSADKNTGKDEILSRIDNILA